jgi:hypothetical protein
MMGSRPIRLGTTPEVATYLGLNSVTAGAEGWDAGQRSTSMDRVDMITHPCAGGVCCDEVQYRRTDS